jgi:hypothetical protein
LLAPRIACPQPSDDEESGLGVLAGGWKFVELGDEPERVTRAIGGGVGRRTGGRVGARREVGSSLLSSSWFDTDR